MNSLERLIASGNGQITDCVPVAPGIGHYAAFQAHEPMTRVAHDPELMARVVLASLERHGYDSCGPITDYALGTESMGSVAVIREWEQTFVGSFAVTAKGDVSRLRLPNPRTDGRMPVILGCERILVDTVGSRVGVNGGLPGPLSFAANLRGPQQILYDIVDDPALVHELLKISTDACKAFGLAQIELGGVKTVNVYEPMATLISNSMVEEFSFAYLADLLGVLKKSGGKILLHICGQTTRLLRWMVEIGSDILSLDVDVDLARAKSIVGCGASLSGNVAVQDLARLGPDDIYVRACRCIEQAAAGGRYTLSSSCEVPLETPPENIDALVRSAREFGARFLASHA